MLTKVLLVGFLLTTVLVAGDLPGWCPYGVVRRYKKIREYKGTLNLEMRFESLILSIPDTKSRNAIEKWKRELGNFEGWFKEHIEDGSYRRSKEDQDFIDNIKVFINIMYDQDGMSFLQRHMSKLQLLIGAFIGGAGVYYLQEIALSSEKAAKALERRRKTKERRNKGFKSRMPMPKKKENTGSSSDSSTDGDNEEENNQE